MSQNEDSPSTRKCNKKTNPANVTTVNSSSNEAEKASEENYSKIFELKKKIQTTTYTSLRVPIKLENGLTPNGLIA